MVSVRTWRPSSRLTSSLTASGPTGMPSCSAACSIDDGARPSASIETPSIAKVPNTREVKKPRLSLTTIGVFLICTA